MRLWIKYPDMEIDSKQICLNNKDVQLARIAQKVFNKERITEEEGLYLYEKASLGYLGTLANFIREEKNGIKTYFNRNFN